MKNRTQKAIEDYKGKCWKGTEAAFYPSDVESIIESSGGGMDPLTLTVNAVNNALMAGFMIGYRKAKREQRQARKTLNSL